MDFIMDIIILRSELDKLNINEEYVEWGGERFSQEPRKYAYNIALKFYECKDSYYQRVIEEYDGEKYIVLTLDEQKLSSLYDEINKGKDVMQDDLILFFNTLYNNLDKFHIFLYRDEECIDERYLINDVQKFVDLFCGSLNKMTPQGISVSKM